MASHASATQEDSEDSSELPIADVRARGARVETSARATRTERAGTVSSDFSDGAAAPRGWRVTVPALTAAIATQPTTAHAPTTAARCQTPWAGFRRSRGCVSVACKSVMSDSRGKGCSWLVSHATRRTVRRATRTILGATFFRSRQGSSCAEYPVRGTRVTRSGKPRCAALLLARLYLRTVQ